MVRVAVARLNFAPYQYINDNGEIAGFSINMLVDLAKTIGFRIEPVMLDTWPDVLQALKERRADLVADIGYTTERDDYLDFTQGVGPYPVAIIGKVSDKRFATNKQLRGLRIAVGKGFAAEKYLPLYYSKAIAMPMADTAEAVLAVRSGKADLYLGGSLPALTIAREISGADLEIKQQTYYGSGWTHMAVRSDWAILANILSRAISQRRESLYQGFANTLNVNLTGTLPPLHLSAAETEIIGQYASIRLGAVRGMRSLNDVTDDGTHTGIASEFSSYIEHRLGIAMTVTAFDSVNQMIEALLDNRIDLIPFFTPTPEREQVFKFSEPYTKIPFVLVAPVGSPAYWDIDSLSGKNLAVIKRHPIIRDVIRKYPEVKLLEFDNTHEVFSAVADGRADAAVALKLFANRLINEDFSGRVQILSEVDGLRGSFSFASAEASAPLIPIINRVLGEIGLAQRDRIVGRWVAADLHPSSTFSRLIHDYQSLALTTLAGIGVLIALTLFWNRRLSTENKSRIRAERLVVKMTDGLQTGVFQFKHLPDGRRIRIFMNEIARKLGRVSDDDPVDARPRYFEFVHPDDKNEVHSALQYAYTTLEPFRAAFRFQLPDGDWGWFICESSAHIDDDGSVVWSGYFFDLTSERSLIQELNRSLLTKDEFIATAGHELRTPIQNLLLGIETLKASSLDSEQGRILGITAESARVLAEQVNDLLDLSRIDAHELTLNERNVDLRNLVNTVVGTFELSAHQKELMFACQIAPGVPVFVRCDPLRLRQILNNLLGNALKYTEAGFVRMAIELVDPPVDRTVAQPEQRFPRAAATEVAFVKFVIQDSGLGLPENQLERIFEPFATVGTANRVRSGLGLAICQRIVRIMGGQIQVRSKLAKGTTFEVTLPLLTATTADKLDSTDDSSQIGTSEPHGGLATTRPVVKDSRPILIVDDNRLARVTTASLLSDSGYEIHQAEDYNEAIELFGQHPYQAIVTDFRMPSGSGTELAIAIRACVPPGEAGPTLILLTAGITHDELIVAKTVFSAILTKPISTVQLIKTIQSLERTAQST